jgi:thiosulfate reductase cytochrome b subunit
MSILLRYPTRIAHANGMENIAFAICNHCNVMAEHPLCDNVCKRANDNLESNPDITPVAGNLIKRHRLSTRLWHWTNAVALLVLLMSGLMIFNAHPRLYWGQYGAHADPAWLEIGSNEKGGYVRIGSASVETTGVLGRWRDKAGNVQDFAFPDWATLPSAYSLSVARNWHFAFAWVMSIALTLFMAGSLFNGHVQRDLHVRREEWSPSQIWSDIKAHARLKFPEGAAALRYNILQKFSYIGVIFVLIPAMIFSGLTMSPGMDAAWPWLLDLFGGRQSARSVHFICAFLLLGFFAVHMIMVLIAGPLNEVRSIITGWYRVPGKVDILDGNEA